MSNDAEGKKRLLVDLFEMFSVMRTYGKEPESLKTMAKVFVRELSGFSADAVSAAMRKHAAISPEPPTLAEILSLIRFGRHPLRESEIISIS